MERQEEIEDIELLTQYIQWYGAIHENNCPQDDTCECKYKKINDAINRSVDRLIFYSKRPADRLVELNEDDLRSTLDGWGVNNSVELAEVICRMFGAKPSHCIHMVKVPTEEQIMSKLHIGWKSVSIPLQKSYRIEANKIKELLCGKDGK